MGKVDVGLKDLAGATFESYVYDGRAGNLGKGVGIYVLDSSVE